MAEILVKHSVDRTKDGKETGCSCGHWQARGEYVDTDHAEHLGLVLTAAGFGHTGAAQATALREAQARFAARLPDGTGNGRAYSSHQVAAMLGERADALDQPPVTPPDAKKAIRAAVHRVRWVEAFGRDAKMPTDERITEAVLLSLGLPAVAP